jgi:diguanylate cyclase (GGDEF)-like protein/PAS domain S-box-containing protein
MPVYLASLFHFYQKTPQLIWLAVALDVISSVVAARMLARPLPRAPGRSLGRLPGRGQKDGGHGWTTNAAIVFGCGMWCSHVLVLLTYRSAVPVYYEPVAVVFSLLVAVGGTMVAFSVARPRDDSAGHEDILVAGVALGVTLYAAQSVRLAAIRLPNLVVVEPRQRMLALGLAAVLGVAAMAAARACRRQGWRGGRLSARQVLTALLLALLIAVPPFVTLYDSQLVPSRGLESTGDAIGSALGSPMAFVALALVCVCIIAAAVTVAVLDHRRALRHQETSRLRHFADGTFEAILIHRDGVVLDVNAALCVLLGYPAKQLIGRHVLQGVQLGYRDCVRERIATGDCAPAELKIRTAHGLRLVEVLARPLEYEGGPAFMLAMRDLTDRRAAEEWIRYLAHHDSLTGLANRPLLSERLEQALALAARQGHCVAVLALDLDRFKLVNDLLGHVAGDAVLTEVARRLRACVRGIDTIARVGGDEFVIVQPAITDASDAEALAQRVIAAICQPFDIDGQPVSIGTSVGLALYPGDSQAPDDLLKQADIALYRSKAGGRGMLRCFEPGMNERLIERRRLEHALRQALHNGSLRLHYHLRYSCASGVAGGCEAALDWPEEIARAGIDPLRVAEEIGMAAELGFWMLRTACRDALGWPASVRVAVHLTPTLLRRADLVEQVAAVLAGSGLPPGRLDLQVSGDLNEEPERVQDALQGLKDLGVQLTLDDFGTGAASLEFLRRFSFDRIKLDHSLTAGIGTEHSATEIARAILLLSHTLHLAVCAEGVTTREQFAVLRAEGCHEVQGSRQIAPMPADELAVMLNETALLPMVAD